VASQGLLRTNERLEASNRRQSTRHWQFTACWLNRKIDGTDPASPAQGLAADCVVLTVLVFLLLNPILAAFITIVTATVVVVLGLAANWEDHSTFEQREAVRAVKRKEKWDRNKDVRERDRARWEAHQAQQARKAKP
jgi:hypothetical protein